MPSCMTAAQSSAMLPIYLIYDATAKNRPFDFDGNPVTPCVTRTYRSNLVRPRSLLVICQLLDHGRHVRSLLRNSGLDLGVSASRGGGSRCGVPGRVGEVLGRVDVKRGLLLLLRLRSLSMYVSKYHLLAPRKRHGSHMNPPHARPRRAGSCPGTKHPPRDWGRATGRGMRQSR
jgi:hypothetical protein